MKMLKTFLLFGLPILLVCVSTFYYTFYKTTHIGGEIGGTPAWYSKNMFFVYISRKGSGGFPSILGNLPKTSRIKGADLETFEYIDDGFAKDKNYFYYPSDVTVSRPDEIDYSYFTAERVELDSTKPLRTVSVELRDDSSLSYTKYYIFGEAVFIVMKYDTKHLGQSSIQSGRVGREKDSDINNPVWHKFDYESFIPFPCGYIKDKNGVYPTRLSGLSTIEGVDIESFTAKFDQNPTNSEDPCYATDRNYQYYYSRGGKYNELEVKRKPLGENLSILEK
jgi:DKNYY family